MTTWHRLPLRVLLAILASAVMAQASTDPIPFDSEHWSLQNGEFVEYLDRPCLQGGALLKDVEFLNGIIEVDIAVDGERGYPGISFRRRSQAARENFYIRPHQSERDDALQYAPVFSGSTEWQLYSGFGFTAAAEIPTDTWIPIRLEIKDHQARVFFNDPDRPALVIHDLKHDPQAGGIMLSAGGESVTHWSNFRYEARDDLVFEPPLTLEAPAGILTEWEVSRPLKVTQIDRERHPAAQELPESEWQAISALPDGLVDLGQHFAHFTRVPDVVLARTLISAESSTRRKLVFGYSDEISIFLNGKILFRGDSSYHSRGPSYLGLINWLDAVFLDLAPGDNELLLMVSETFGGWGFQARLEKIGSPAVTVSQELSEAWVIPTSMFGAPESVIWDPERQLLYVSIYYAGPVGGEEFIAKFKPDGQIDNLKWVTGLNRPTGLCLRENRLMVVTREQLLEIDAATGEIMGENPFPDPQFPNDVAVDTQGIVYVSDSRGDFILKFQDGQFETWLDGPAVNDPNGLLVHAGKLYYGNSGEGTVRAVDLKTKQVEIVAFLGAGAIIDGLIAAPDGSLIVSDYNGCLYRIRPSGQKSELMNTTAARYSLADFTYVPEQDLLIIPTLFGAELRAYSLQE